LNKKHHIVYFTNTNRFDKMTQCCAVGKGVSYIFAHFFCIKKQVRRLNMLRKSLFILTLVACLAAVGCNGKGQDVVSEEISTSGEENEVGGKVSDFANIEKTENVGVVVTGEDTVGVQQGDRMEIQDVGCLRISYEGNKSSVRYISDVSDLPDYDELDQYDEAFFEDHGLVLVTESVNSGSMQTGIISVTVEDNTASVTLYHELEGDAGTTDMATWLLWAVVDAGMDDYEWEVVNPALASSLVTE
jgi:hypothetical protein